MGAKAFNLSALAMSIRILETGDSVSDIASNNAAIIGFGWHLVFTGDTRL